jgi:AP2-like factor (ANT lineage)
MAYDIAAIEHRGLNAVTNFDVSRYMKWHHLCRAGDADGFHDSGQLPVDMAPHPTVDLDEAMAVAAPPSHAALGLLLQSPGFKEMIERTAASEGNNTPSPSSSSCSPSPPPAPTQQEQQPEYSGGASSARCSFPDDVQTYFGCEDHDGGVGYTEVDTFLFGDLGAYAAPMFQFELDV